MKNSFIVQFAVHLLIVSIGVTGFPATILAYVASLILGYFLDKGILEIDLSMDSLREALKEDQWKDAAKKAYDHASARVYTEPEKENIRQEYLDALSKYVSIGVPNSPGPDNQDLHGNTIS